jgi:hypothetical protein
MLTNIGHDPDSVKMKGRQVVVPFGRSLTS